MKPLLKENTLIQVKDILKAHQNLKDVVIHTPLQKMSDFLNDMNVMST